MSFLLQLPLVSAGGPQILKGCATPNVCHLQVNTILGPEASGFHLISKPECDYMVTTPQPSALNSDFLGFYLFLPFPDPTCPSQSYVFPGYPLPLPYALRECNYPQKSTHIHTHTPCNTLRSRKSCWHTPHIHKHLHLYPSTQNLPTEEHTFLNTSILSCK